MHTGLTPQRWAGEGGTVEGTVEVGSRCGSSLNMRNVSLGSCIFENEKVKRRI